MKTDALIAALAERTTPVAPRAPLRAIGLACLVGAAGATILLFAWLGPRPDLHLAMRTAGFWIKQAYTLWLAIAGLALAERLSRPGGRPGRVVWLLVAGFTAIVLAGAVAVAASPPEQRMLMVMGGSWRVCPWRIVVFSLPAFAALLMGLRHLAPTRLALAGAAAGLLAGAIGASLYGLACGEGSPMFVAIWYTLGMGACAAIGALCGPRLLRW